MDVHCADCFRDKESSRSWVGGADDRRHENPRYGTTSVRSPIVRTNASADLAVVYRLRISSCGIIDVLLHDTQEQEMSLLQQEDLLMFGTLIFVLMTGNVSATNPTHFPQSVEAMRSRSSDLQALVGLLMNKMPKVFFLCA